MNDGCDEVLHRISITSPAGGAGTLSGDTGNGTQRHSHLAGELYPPGREANCLELGDPS